MQDSDRDHNYRLALITGATGAIGKAIAEEIARRPGYKVVLLCRDGQKAEQAVNDIVTQSGNELVSYETVDVSSKDSIQAVARRLPGPFMYW